MTDRTQSLRLILVTGNPGAGKTALSFALWQRLEGWSWIPADGFAYDEERRRIAKGARIPVSWPSVRRVGYRNARRAIREMVDRQARVLVDAGLRCEWESGQFHRAARVKRGGGLAVMFNLRCRLETSLSRRLNARDLKGAWGGPGSPEREAKAREVYFDPVNRVPEELRGSTRIETDGKRKREVLEEVLSHIR